MSSTPQPGRYVALYARVSTLRGQDTEVQLRELREHAQRQGWDATEFVDRGQSGRKESRPEFDRMMQAVRERRIKLVCVWRLDRLSRGLRQAVNVLSEFKELKVEFVSLRDGLNFTGPLGMALYALVAALAEAEVEALRERTLAGLRHARAKGKRLGRPRAEVDVKLVMERRDQGLSLREIGKELGVSRTTIAAVIKSVSISTLSK